VKVIDFVKHVATAAGVAYYHAPIGTPIVAHPDINQIHSGNLSVSGTSQTAGLTLHTKGNDSVVKYHGQNLGTIRKDEHGVFHVITPEGEDVGLYSSRKKAVLGIIQHHQYFTEPEPISPAHAALDLPPLQEWEKELMGPGPFDAPTEGPGKVEIVLDPDGLQVGTIVHNPEGSSKKYTVYDSYGVSKGEANTFTGAQYALGSKVGKPSELQPDKPVQPNLPEHGAKVVLVEQLNAAPIGAKVTYYGDTSTKVYTKAYDQTWTSPSGVAIKSDEFKPAIAKDKLDYGDTAPTPPSTDHLPPAEGEKVEQVKQLEVAPVGAKFNLGGVEYTKNEYGHWVDDSANIAYQSKDFYANISNYEVTYGAAPKPPTPSAPEKIAVSGAGQTAGLKLTLGKNKEGQATTKVHFHGQHIGTSVKFDMGFGQYHAKDSTGKTISAHSSRKDAVAAIVKHHNATHGSTEQVSPGDLASVGKRPTKSPGHANFGFNTAPGLHADHESSEANKTKTAKGIGKRLNDEYLSKLSDDELNTVYANFNTYGYGLPEAFDRGSNGQLFPMTTPPVGSGYIRKGDPAYRETLSEFMASNLISTWADTSNDQNTMSLAVQNRAQEIFGVGDAAPWKLNGQTKKDLAAYEANNKVLLDNFLRAQYFLTQKYLKDKNIESIDLVRGFTFGYGVETPEWAQFGAGSTFKIQMRPLSSWSTQKSTAQGFGSTIVWTTVPRDKILGMPGSGFGCLNEYEVVVIGGNTEVYRA